MNQHVYLALGKVVEVDGMTETRAMNIPVKCEIPHMLPRN